MATKKYFHELPQLVIDKMITDKKTYGYIMGKFKQPNWCMYPDALEGMMGCWSLTDFSKNGLRTKISNEFCENCPEYNKPPKQK